MLDRFRKGKSAIDLNIPAYTNWDDFVADEIDEPDGDDGVHHEDYKHLIHPEMVKRHLEEKPE